MGIVQQGLLTVWLASVKAVNCDSGYKYVKIMAGANHYATAAPVKK